MAKVSPRLAWISIAPVKGLALVPLEEAHLGPEGVAGDRAFHLVDREGKLVNGKRLRPATPARPGVTKFYGRPGEGRIVRGPWEPALSEYARTTLRLVRVAQPGEGHDRGAR